MTTNLEPDRAYVLELLAAAQTLRPDAAPLVAALVRGGCLVVPDPEPLLALLDGLGHGDTTAGTEAAQGAMLAAWRGVHAPVPGVPPEVGPWLALAEMGIWDQARAALVFALAVTHAGMVRAASDELRPLLLH